ncbi:pitrilysin family protein [Oscillatoria sp. CS-180]|uniref:M16 family metallopeptidase n=1 Tax=Oscillatoria sp. CS-180 TaxID=3021720 RepID=UPI00232E4909|nr:pitrilysin family protein [Oscillatoria sp. CS-180]MDB9528154.1 pitrilysin family protein [Oscillatoria sp. CS-180]
MTSPPSVDRPLLHRTVLKNGLVVVVIENSVADIVSARMLVRAGSGHETRSQAGLFSLISSLLTKGTQQFTSMEIAEQVESIGASLGSDASADYSLVSLKTVSADFEPILALAAEVIRHPSFPEAELDLEKRLTLQSIRSMREQPFTTAYNALRAAMYGEHPYSLPGIGTEDSVALLSQDDLFQTHKAYYRPDNCVLVVAGRITVDKAVALAEQNFGDWEVPDQPLPPLVYPTLPLQPTHQEITQLTNQAIIIIGYQSPTVKDPAYGPLKLISTYLGNGLSSRLFVELREKRGLAYDVSAFYPTRLSHSQFVAHMGTAPENRAIALAGLRDETERLGEAGLTVEELEASKNKLLGQYALGKQTNAQTGQLLGWYEILGLGVEFDQVFQETIRKVTAEEIRTAAQAYLTEPFVVVLGPT